MGHGNQPLAWPPCGLNRLRHPRCGLPRPHNHHAALWAPRQIGSKNCARINGGNRRVIDIPQKPLKIHGGRRLFHALDIHIMQFAEALDQARRIPTPAPQSLHIAVILIHHGGHRQ